MRVNKLKFWCQKVLPLVYDDSLSYYEVLCKLANKINEIIDTGVGIGIADPIQWNITNQYPQNTIVVDSDGTAYISKQPVPVGVEIDNENYWLPVFNYGVDMDTLRSQICYNAKERETTEVTLASGDLVFWKGLLYKVIVDMNAGTAFIVDSNIEKVTVNDVIKDIVKEIENNYTELDTKINNLETETEADFNNLEAQIAVNEEDATNATQNISENQLLFLNHKLYIATRDIPIGTTYIVGTNIEAITVDEKFSNTVISTLEYVTPQMYGADGDGTTEDSTAIQRALDSGKPVVFPTGTYVCRNVYRTDDTILLGCNGAVLKPYYIDGIAQDMISVSNASNFYMENITIQGEFHGVTNLDILRKTAIELTNIDNAIIYNCLFDRIDDSLVTWEEKFRDRKAMTLTAHDVSYLTLENVHFNGMGAEESCWITNKNKDMSEINVNIINCSASNMTRLSLFDIIAGNINIDGLVIEENCSFQTYSIMNLFGDYTIVKNSKFYGEYGDAIDTYEGGSYFGKSVLIENCVFNGYSSHAIQALADNITIEKCTDYGRTFLLVANDIATIPGVITGMDGDAYTVYKPINKIIVDNCWHKSVIHEGDTTAFHIFLARVGGTFIYKNNYSDQDGIKGDAAFVNKVDNAIIENNTFKNAGYIAFSNSIKAHVELTENTINAYILNNESDSEAICGIMTNTINNLKIYGNNIKTGTAPVVTNGGSNANKVSVLETDTTRITVKSDNYTTFKGDVVEGAWIAGSSSANQTQLTNKITLYPGVYIISVELPYCASEFVTELHNYTTGGSHGNIPVKTYGIATTIITIYQTCEIALRSASSASVTFSNYGGKRIIATPLKLG